MKFVSKSKELKELLSKIKTKNTRLGFVPTMGALHSGHLSLIKKARKECDIVVCSIYVNPTQFNVVSDLDKYPRTLEADIKLIEEECDVLFAPSSFQEVYGKEIVLEEFDFGGIELELEGEFRPGHFQGMANVVSKFFQIIEPNNAYFGLKDFQQYCIVKELVKILKKDINIIGCEIVREENGLARSSRNELLSEEGRKSASVIYYSLNYLKQFHSYFGVEEVREKAKNMIQGILEVEYLEIRDSKTLSKIKKWEDSEEIFVSFAGMIDGVRLIDNVRF